MKRNLAFFPILALCLLVVLQCGDDDGPATNTPSGPITYLRVDHHGCSGLPAKSEDGSACAFLKASAYDGSNLALTVHFVANCCPGFVSAVTVTDRLVEIALADTIAGCRCICSYEDDFVFTCPATGDLQVRVRLEDSTCEFDTLIAVQR